MQVSDYTHVLRPNISDDRRYAFMQLITSSNNLVPGRIICLLTVHLIFFFFSSRRRHTSCSRDWSSDVCSSDLPAGRNPALVERGVPAAAALLPDGGHRLRRQSR